MSSEAQDEFNRLINKNKVYFSSHPEDRDNKSDLDSDSDGDQDGYAHSNSEDYDDDTTKNMVSRGGANTGSYRIPDTVFDANTGPKGVIADAQAFERARKSSFRRTFGMDFAFSSSKKNSNNNTLEKKGRASSSRGNGFIGERSPHSTEDKSDGDDEERFMLEWREARMRELQSRNQAKRPGPRGKAYGFVETVDAEAYLDAIEKAPPDTTVVVCIYDPDSSASAIVEDSLFTISRRQPATRFIKLHHEIAEMDHVEAPALLAYRSGDVFATIVDIFRQLPRGRDCSADSLEDLLKLNRVL
ncbi:hypothetical protein MAP00_002018 [Monascus purpureus]|nr:hypothetical protein MAP00_002018 [Monascus purpureus]